MSHICDYGSEFHLLRYLGRHRAYLNARVLETIGADAIAWIDFHFDRRASGADDELKGLEFIEDPDTLAAWAQVWPGGSQSLSWDSVAQLRTGEASSFLLLDACSSIGDLASSCQASNGKREQIQAALEHTRERLDVPAECDWMNRYYGLASRLAALAFLRERGIDAHFMRLYFVGDEHPRHHCPQSSEEWKEVLVEQSQQIGLPPGHSLVGRIHELFLPICPLGCDAGS